MLKRTIAGIILQLFRNRNNLRMKKGIIRIFMLLAVENSIWNFKEACPLESWSVQETRDSGEKIQQNQTTKKSEGRSFQTYFWPECYYKTWENPVISMVLVQQARGFSQNKEGQHWCRFKLMPYEKSRTQGTKPLWSHPFSHPARSFPPTSANEHPWPKSSQKPDTQFHKSTSISCHPMAAERGLVRWNPGLIR